MDFLTKLERKYGKYAIPNLTLILISGFILGYLIEIFMPEGLQLLAMNPEKILHGQIYRLVTWVVIPPSSASILVIITLFFYFSIGRTLENSWGDFRYTVYILSGIIFTDIGMMGTYLVMHLMGQSQLLDMYYQAGLYGASTYYLCMSMFLAYAFMFPDMQVLLYFIIPIKVKWLGYLDIAYLLVMILQYGYMQYYTGMVTVIMSVLNFILFYFMSKGKTKMTPAQRKRKRKYKQQVRQSQILTRHKCAICGQTELDNPNLEFRYCSRCKGNYEYCQNHLFTHEHKR
ncbi:putative uncharacterized protein [Clostridium sp. CAG:590]|nr:hypothetical protein [Clostridium sp.]CCX86007.1 putative uncharacterized protein [Clostridium sp. CAG:590]